MINTVTKSFYSSIIFKIVPVPDKDAEKMNLENRVHAIDSVKLSQHLALQRISKRICSRGLQAMDSTFNEFSKLKLIRHD